MNFKNIIFRTNSLYIFKYGKWIVMPITWYCIGLFDVDKLQDKSYNNGYKLSQYFKKYPYWDRYIEHIIVKQFNIIFIAGYSFIKGMTSDNINYQTIHKNIDNNINNVTLDNKYKK